LIRNLPNLLTLLRLALALLMFAALAVIASSLSGARPLSPQLGAGLARFAFAAFVVAAATDFFDGWLARRWGVTSLTGAILDPIADKILVCGAILGLMAVGAPGVMVAGGLILFREFAVSALREVLAPLGVKLPVTLLAKSKTTLQLVSLGGLMFLTFWPAWRIDASVVDLIKALQAFEILFALAAAVTLWTGIDYARSAWLALRGRGGPPASAERPAA
jgi:CDP-diacylglycerol--glycerol-3-phosphate 3-phosphatidyltransferase